MPSSIIGPIAGALVGGLMSDSGGGQQQTQNREPWKPTQQPLQDLVGQGQALGNYYQQNPFNAPQQQSYQNLFGDIDAFRSQMAPGLMGFANQLMGTNYRRAPAGTERMGGQGMPQQGLLGGQGGMPQQAGMPARGMFPTAPRPQSAYGLLDFRALNPDTSIQAQRAADAAKQPENPLLNDQLIEDYLRRRDPQAWTQWNSGRQYGDGGA
ncbi:MAG: hypothetical protein KGM60_10890 [Comamonadaceae bacterium]|nr:hypothetical protein [Comamonadaceae bacterium]